MRVDVYAVDMTEFGCEAAVVRRPGNADHVVMILDETVSLVRVDKLMGEYLTSEEHVAARISCSCATPQARGAHGGGHLDAWHMAVS